MSEQSFLTLLLAKKANLFEINEKTGKDTTSALKEVNRQIKQCLTGGNLNTGEGVTKSGGKGD
jgi:hypothetical protein